MMNYEGYSINGPSVLVKEKLDGANIYETEARSILSKATGFISAYDFTLNPYRGCKYGCSYCYAAAFSPNSQMRQDWGNWVIVKRNAVELLEKELARWQKKHPDQPPRIYMSSVTDPYQPIETKQKLTRQLLETMVPYQPQLVIQTRSPMIGRDTDLLQEFHWLRVNMSIPTGSENVRKDFEPRSPSVKARLQAIGKLKHSIPSDGNHDVKFSVTITPLLPIFPEDTASFIQKLSCLDRVVIQKFHASNQKTLVASTRQEAISLKNKYAWWYDREGDRYDDLKDKLSCLGDRAGVEVMEGREGFVYD